MASEMPLIEVDSIDWSDPIAANKQLKAQLAALEAQQASRGSRRSHQVQASEPQFHEDHYTSNYGYDDILTEDFDDDIMYENTAPQRMQKRRGGTRKKNKNTASVGRKKSSNRTFNDTRCREIDRGNVALLKRLSAIHTGQRNSRSTLDRGVAPTRRKKIGSNGINMRRKQDKIAEENRRFAARLQSVKGTKSLSRKSMKKWKKKTKSLSKMTREISTTASRGDWQPIAHSRRRGQAQPEWN